MAQVDRPARADRGHHRRARRRLRAKVPHAAAGVPAPGEVVTIVAPGTLAIGEASREVEAELEVTVEGERLVVRGTIDLLLSDLGIEAPRAPIVLSVSDAASIEVQLFLVRA